MAGVALPLCTRRLGLALGLTLGPLAAQTPDANTTKPAYLLAGPPALLRAAEPLCERRAQQGLQVVRVALGDDATDATLADRIRAVMARHGTGYLLLLGPHAATPARQRPGLAATAAAGERYAHCATQIRSDLGYVDLDDDGRAEWAHGRLPLATAADIGALVQKILSAEDADAGAWQRELALLSTDGGLPTAVEHLAERALRRVLDADIHPALTVRPRLGLRTSPFYIEPSAFRGALWEALRRGPLVTLFVGHGWPDRLAPMQGHPVLGPEDFRTLEGADRSVMLLLACRLADCLAADSFTAGLVAAPGGPCAVVGATAATHRLSDALLAHHLLRRLRPTTTMPRLGDLVRLAKRALLADDDDALSQQVIGLARTLGLDADRALRRYTADVYHLLGDPAMPLCLPRPLEVAVRRPAGKPAPLDVSVAALPPDGPRPAALQIALGARPGHATPPGLDTDVTAVDWSSDGPLHVEIATSAADRDRPVVRAFGYNAHDAWAGGAVLPAAARHPSQR